MIITILIISVLLYFKIRHMIRSWVKNHPLSKITWVIVGVKFFFKSIFRRKKRYSEAEFYALEMDYHKEKDKAAFWKDRYFKLLGDGTK